MINKNKIQMEILKSYLNGERVDRIKVDETVMIAINGHYGYVIDEETLLNIEMLPEQDVKLKLADKQISDTCLSVHTESCIMRKLKLAENSGYIHVNEKIYKNFKDCKMFGSDENSPVFCYDDIGELFGIMMPIRNRDAYKEE